MSPCSAPTLVRFTSDLSSLHSRRDKREKDDEHIRYRHTNHVEGAFSEVLLPCVYVGIFPKIDLTWMFQKSLLQESANGTGTSQASPSRLSGVISAGHVA